jgi:hypothetical protein
MPQILGRDERVLLQCLLNLFRVVPPLRPKCAIVGGPSFEATVRFPR